MKGLGERIRAIRKSKSMTLTELAKHTSIDPATLSRIENGKMTGTLDSHMRIASAFGVTLPELYQNVLVAISERAEKQTRQRMETLSHSKGAVSEILTTGILLKKMTPTLLKLRPQGRTTFEEYPLGTERFLYQLKGSIELHIGSTIIRLCAGECHYFHASQPHYIKNPTKTDSQCLSVMTLTLPPKTGVFTQRVPGC